LQSSPKDNKQKENDNNTAKNKLHCATVGAENVKGGVWELEQRWAALQVDALGMWLSVCKGV
jgi:hypothetical protein